MYPLVSVIIPVYNVKPYLYECINSVIKQTYKNLEIIIIDDGSIDGSSDICDQFKRKDDRIVVIHQENTGLSGARNAGLNAMSGDIVAFLDSDDAFLPNMIEVMVRRMLRDKADIVICGFYVCRTESHLSLKHWDNICVEDNCVLSSKDALHYMIDGKINTLVWNKIYHKNLFRSHRFPNGHYYEDLILMPHIFEEAKLITIIDKPLIIYRKRNQSITSTLSKSIVYDWLRANKYKERFIMERIPSVFLKEHFVKWNRTFLIYLVSKGAELSSVSDNEIRNLKRIIDKEINKRRGYEKNLNAVGKLQYYSYLLSPYLYRVLLKCYHLLISIKRAVLHQIIR